MRVTNARIGFATNSSSTHSIIMLPPGSGGLSDEYGRDGLGQFGWDYFTLASREAKRRYVSVALREALAASMPTHMATTVASKWFDTEVEDGDYIDHQSLVDFPYTYGGKIVDLDFVNDFCEALMHDRVAILGGNDNDDYTHPASGDGVAVLPAMPVESGIGQNLICRKEAPKVWTLFNTKNGARFTIDFNKPCEVNPEPVFTSPLLVDVKLTDFCPYACAFCYQGSTAAGKHADWQDVTSLLNALSNAKVFEVAFGGGEPTLHPYFVNIIKTCRSYGIVPNFTTRNYKWLSDPEQRDQILPNIGGFAYSVENPSDLEKAISYCKTFGALNKLSIQMIDGVVEDYDFKQMFDICKREGVRVTILGFKDTGRGKSTKRVQTNIWKVLDKYSQEYWSTPVGVDTAIAQQYPKEMEKFSKVLYHRTEGTHSMYVDLVANQVGPSSYAPDRMVPIKSLYRVVSDHFPFSV